MLESRLLQWSDYDASYEQILKWLKVMEKHLRNTQPKSDMSEKKAELQRVKVSKKYNYGGKDELNTQIIFN